jgi:hypothetical protein
MSKLISVEIEKLEEAVFWMERVRLLMDRIGSQEGAGDPRAELAELLLSITRSERWYLRFTKASNMLWDAAERQISAEEYQALITRTDKRNERLRKKAGI